MEEPTPEAVREETLAALEMPREGLRRWLAADRAFCHAHGGPRVYGPLLAILEAAEGALPCD
jgi:hypothetical protein